MSLPYLVKLEMFTVQVLP